MINTQYETIFTGANAFAQETVMRGTGTHVKRFGIKVFVDPPLI